MVRAVLGSVLLLVGLPMLLAGGVLWFATQHRDDGGAYRAPLSEVSTQGYAVVAPDMDALLRRDVPFARAGRTTLRVTAHTDTGPAFVGLAPASDVATYLADVPYTQVDEVRLARGPLPVAVSPVEGAGEPAGPPHEQPFWLAASAAGTVEWAPADLRDQQLALVVMSRDGSAPLTVELAAELRPQWLASTTFGALVLGSILVLCAIGALAWPSRAREIVYVVPPAQIPEVAAHLGVHVAVPALPAPEAGWILPAPPAPVPPAPVPPALAPPALAPPASPTWPAEVEPAVPEGPTLREEQVGADGAITAEDAVAAEGESGSPGPAALPVWPPPGVGTLVTAAPIPAAQEQRDAGSRNAGADALEVMAGQR